jgi:hypothetical protein
VRNVRNAQALPNLTREQILGWAQEHHRRTGGWPTEDSGPLLNASGEVWANVNAAPREQILAWAQAHHQRTGRWPNCEDGLIEEVPGETWNGINLAL